MRLKKQIKQQELYLSQQKSPIIDQKHYQNVCNNMRYVPQGVQQHQESIFSTNVHGMSTAPTAKTSKSTANFKSLFVNPNDQDS